MFIQRKGDLLPPPIHHTCQWLANLPPASTLLHTAHRLKTIDDGQAVLLKNHNCDHLEMFRFLIFGDSYVCLGPNIFHSGVIPQV